jgi:hypothetical protein
MNACNKLTAFAIVFAMVAAPLFGAAAETETRTKAHSRYYAYRQPQPYVRRSPDGALIDSNGWRLRDGHWDNTCFRTLDYMPSMWACDPGRHQ